MFEILVLIILKETLTFCLKIIVAAARSISTEKVTRESFKFKLIITTITPIIMNMSPKRVTIPEDSISFSACTSVVILVRTLQTGFLSKNDISILWK